MTSTASGAGRGVAVLAAAGGLVATIALPASAAPEAAPASAPAAVTTVVDSAFGTAVPAVVSAPAAATPVTTAATFTSVPTPAPVIVAPVVTTQTSTTQTATTQSSTTTAPASKARTTKATTTADATTTEATATEATATADTPVTVTRKARGAKSVPTVQALVPDAPAAVVVEPVATVAEVVAPAPAPAPAPSLGQRILDTAAQYAGTPYVYGGATPAGFDCSGYTSYVMAQVGIGIPRTANAQKSASAPLDRSQAVPGDLVFFSNGGRAYHVGIYAGGNLMWDSPRTGKPVALREIWSSAVTFGRVAPVV